MSGGPNEFSPEVREVTDYPHVKGLQKTPTDCSAICHRREVKLKRNENEVVEVKEEKLPCFPSKLSAQRTLAKQARIPW